MDIDLRVAAILVRVDNQERREPSWSVGRLSLFHVQGVYMCSLSETNAAPT